MERPPQQGSATHPRASIREPDRPPYRQGSAPHPGTDKEWDTETEKPIAAQTITQVAGRRVGWLLPV
eukprot:10843284-Prorocentrum_lima.AAC.1